MSLKIRNLTKFYGKNKILDDISFEMKSGESIALMGSSGSGKSTLAKCIARLTNIDSGEMILDTKNALRIKEKEFRKNLQYVFQDQLTALNPAKKIFQLLNDVLRRFKNSDNIELEHILSDARIPKKLLNRYPSELSGGERQRLGIARAMLVKPRVIILDEVTSALDKGLKLEIMDLLEHYKTLYKTSMIFITHNENIAKEYFDKTLKISNSKLIP